MRLNLVPSSKPGIRRGTACHVCLRSELESFVRSFAAVCNIESQLEYVFIAFKSKIRTGRIMHSSIYPYKL